MQDEWWHGALTDMHVCLWNSRGMQYPESTFTSLRTSAARLCSNTSVCVYRSIRLQVRLVVLFWCLSVSAYDRNAFLTTKKYEFMVDQFMSEIWNTANILTRLKFFYCLRSKVPLYVITYDKTKLVNFAVTAANFIFTITSTSKKERLHQLCKVALKHERYNRPLK